jgi:hypothetical protein
VPGDKVYAAVRRGVGNGQGIRITSEDARVRPVQFTNGEQIAGIKARPLGDNPTHMMISSAAGRMRPRSS